MIDAIINTFFYVKKKNKPITYLSDRQISKNFSYIRKTRRNCGGTSTELSRYFWDNVGLNSLERERARTISISGHSLR